MGNKLTVQKMIDWLLSVRNPNAELVIQQRWGLGDKIEDDYTEYNSLLFDIYVDDGTDYNEDDGYPSEIVKDKVAIVMYR